MTRSNFYILLKPLSWVYGLITWLRNLLFDLGFIPTYRPSIPVIAVGNLTVGGSGKTPFCIHLYKQLTAAGFSPVILSRGYGGSMCGPLEVQSNHLSSQVGDEPLMYSKIFNLDVVVSRDRCAGARLIEEQQLGDIIILDDGFQHRRIERDINIVCVRASRENDLKLFLTGDLLPLGDFREALSPALKRIDLFVVSSRSANKSNFADSEWESLSAFNKPIFEQIVQKVHIQSLGVEPVELPAQKVLLASGIAEPSGFQKTVQKLGYTVVSHRSFGDHRSFGVAELQKLRDQFSNIPVVCTSKDIVRFKDPLPDWLYECRIESTVLDREKLFTLIMDRVGLPEDSRG